MLVVLYLCASPMTTPLWVPGGWKESAGTYSCLFMVLMYVFTLICAFVGDLCLCTLWCPGIGFGLGSLHM